MAGGFLRRVALAAGLMLVAGAAQATVCEGRDLIAAMPEAQRAAMRAETDAQPYGVGLVWTATRGEARILLIGTYHFYDARHDALMAQAMPVLADADALLVEAGPDEEARLRDALLRDPALMFDADGPTLPERLDAAEWDELSAALAARGMPAVMASRLRPWYVAVMLGISPCMVGQMAAGGGGGVGLDHMLMRAAGAADVPVRAMEPWDTVFTLFAGLTPDEEVDMIRAALPAARLADDYAATMANAYFEGRAWDIWVFSRMEAEAHSGLSAEAIAAQMALTESAMLEARNRAWIAPLTEAAEAAARDGKPVVAGMGALHLPGEAGVLRLLEADGWTITPTPVAGLD